VLGSEERRREEKDQRKRRGKHRQCSLETFLYLYFDTTSTSSSMSASDKNVRYDRQLRLWGDHGQKRLEEAKLLLINGDATGTEILKNLVLPGIGSFTVLDGKKIDEGLSFSPLSFHPFGVGVDLRVES